MTHYNISKRTIPILHDSELAEIAGACYVAHNEARELVTVETFNAARKVLRMVEDEQYKRLELELAGSDHPTNIP